MNRTGERSKSLLGEIFFWLAIGLAAWLVIAYINNACTVTHLSDYHTVLVVVGIVLFAMAVLAGVRYGKKKPLLALILVVVIGLPASFGLDMGLFSLLHAKDLPVIQERHAEERREQENLRLVIAAYQAQYPLTQDQPVIRPPFAVASCSSQANDWRIWSEGDFENNIDGYARYADLFAEPAECRTLLLLHPNFEEVFSNPNYSWSGGADRTSSFCSVVVTVIDLADGIRYADAGLTVAPLRADYQQYAYRSILDPYCYSDENEYQTGSFDAMMDKYLQRTSP